MKVAVLLLSVATLAFVFVGFQTGLFEEPPPPPKEEVVENKPAKPEGRWPEDLGLAVRQQPIAHAASFDRSKKAHRVAIVQGNGTLHRYHENLDEEWRADLISETELVVVLYRDKKEHVEHIAYTPPAPPIDRYRFSLDAFVVEAKTGKVLAIRKFINEPRKIRQTEFYDQKIIGQPVSYRTVNSWLVHTTLAGFPYDPTPPAMVSNSD